jgi:hypothetical protein
MTRMTSTSIYSSRRELNASDAVYRVHGFCLMTTYIHLAIQTAEISLSRIVGNLSFRYNHWVV